MTLFGTVANGEISIREDRHAAKLMHQRAGKRTGPNHSHAGLAHERPPEAIDRVEREHRAVCFEPRGVGTGGVEMPIARSQAVDDE